MKKEKILSYLQSKRAELVEALKQAINTLDHAQISDDLACLDGAIKLIDPDAFRRRSKRKINPLFKRGELSDMLLDVMREASEAGEWLTMRQIAERIAVIRKIDFTSSLEKNVRTAVMSWKNRILIEEKREGLPTRWRVKP